VVIFLKPVFVNVDLDPSFERIRMHQSMLYLFVLFLGYDFAKSFAQEFY